MTYYMAGEGRRQFGQTTPSELRQQVPDVGAHAGGRRRPHHALELPHGHPLLEDDAGAHPRQHGRDQARHRHAALGREPDQGARGGRAAQGRREHGHRRRRRGRARRSCTTRTWAIVSFTGSTGVGRKVSEACAPAFKHCHLEMGGKNIIMVMDDAQARPGGRRRGLGRLRHHRPALHRGQPRGRAQEGLQGVRGPLRRARAKALKVGNGLDPRRPDGPLRQREPARDGREVRGDRQGRGREAPHRRQPPRQGRPREGFFHEPTIFGDCSPKMRIAQEEIFGPVVSVIPVDSLEEAIEVGNSVEYGLSAVDLHPGHQQGLHGHARHVHRDLLRQRAHHRRRDPPAVRRHQEHRQRPPRGLRAGAGRVLGVEVASTSTTAARLQRAQIDTD